MVNSNKKSANICSRCGFELIFVSQETVRLEGMLYPQTNTIYRCSNTECQKKKEKESADRLKSRLDKEAIDKQRAEKIQEKRKLVHKAKGSE